MTQPSTRRRARGEEWDNRTLTRVIHVRLDQDVYGQLQRLKRRTGMAPGTLGRIGLTVWLERPTLEEPLVGMDLIEWLEATPAALSLVSRLRAESIDSRRPVQDLLTDDQALQRLLAGQPPDPRTRG